MRTPAFPLWVSLLASLGALTTVARAATVEPIVPPAKRAEVLTQARAMLAPRPAPPAIPNPFHTAAFFEAIATASGRGESETTSEPTEAPRPATSGTRSNRDLLAAIAGSLRPSGYFVVGGQPTLVFGQKRVKAGGLLTVTYEGTEYNLEVTALDRTHFTLRLNREEFTRPIK